MKPSQSPTAPAAVPLSERIMLTVREAGALLGFEETTSHALANAGIIPWFELPGVRGRQVLREELTDAIKERAVAWRAEHTVATSVATPDKAVRSRMQPSPRKTGKKRVLTK